MTSDVVPQAPWRARAAVALFLANAGAVVLLWWTGSGERSLGDLPGELNAAGRVTGLVGTYLVLVQLVLRTHVPWLVDAFGKDALRSAHTRNAYVALGLLLAHAVFQTIAYAIEDRLNLAGEIVHLVLYYDGLLISIVGLLLLVALTALSLGRFDPTGLVKGWAIERVCAILERAGHRDYFVDGAGDVRTRGEREPGIPWRVGIRHPFAHDLVAHVLETTDLAIATSGTYEKGAHIRDPWTGLAATDLVSFTVVGPDIVDADAYATASFAMGMAGLAFIERLPGYEAYAIDPALRSWWTTGFAAHRAAECPSGAPVCRATPDGTRSTDRDFRRGFSAERP